jgi:hypothetical protein
MKALLTTATSKFQKNWKKLGSPGHYRTDMTYWTYWTYRIPFLTSRVKLFEINHRQATPASKLLRFFLSCQRCQALFGLLRVRRNWILSDQLAPGGAVVVKSFGRAIKYKPDALPVVSI